MPRKGFEGSHPSVHAGERYAVPSATHKPERIRDSHDGAALLRRSLSITMRHVGKRSASSHRRRAFPGARSWRSNPAYGRPPNTPPRREQRGMRINIGGCRERCPGGNPHCAVRANVGMADFDLPPMIARAAILTRVLGVNAQNAPSSICRFEGEDVDEAGPHRVQHAFGGAGAGC